MEQKYKVLQAFGDFQEGDVVERKHFDETVTDEVFSGFLIDGVLEEVKEDDVSEDLDTGNGDVQEEEEVTDNTEEENKEEVVTGLKVFEGKNVVSDTVREVNGVEYHCVKLEDGSSQDLTDEVYELELSKQ